MNQIIFRQGTLKWKEKVFPVDFALINEKKGAFTVELYYEPDNQLYNFFEPFKWDDYINEYYELQGKSTENDKIIVSKLRLTNIQFDPLNIAKFNCQGSVRLTKKDHLSRRIEKENKLFYIVLEGMDMVFHEVSQKQVVRNGQNESILPEINRDHNYYILQWANDVTSNWYMLKLIFEKSEKPNTTLLKIEYISKPAVLLLETEYFRIKQRLLEFLSFYNGGYVVVRSEYLGGFRQINKVSAQTTVTYSFLEFEHYDLSNYLPVRDSFNGNGSGIHTYFDCFQQFLDKYEMYDLGSIIQILNGVNDSGSIEQRFYTLIITLEKIAHKVYLEHGGLETEIIPGDIYSSIGTELINVLEKYKQTISNKKGYSELKSKLGEINIRKRGETTNKFMKLFEVANIELTTEIHCLITGTRNSSVHKGEIGEGDEPYVNYKELDKLVRDIVLNLMGYKGYRKPKTW
jgi:hypothetical protein